jgi:co-chaperonin GroES (HSP10)
MRSKGAFKAGSRGVACRAATAIPPKVISTPHLRAAGTEAFRLGCPRLDLFAHRPFLSQFKGVKPSGDRVLVKVDKEEGRTQGGVLLPTVAQNKPTAGAVVALGDVELVQVRSDSTCRCMQWTDMSYSAMYGCRGILIGCSGPPVRVSAPLAVLRCSFRIIRGLRLTPSCPPVHSAAVVW